MAAGRNAQEGTSEDVLGACGDISTAYFWGQDPNSVACMGYNGPNPKREGGLLDY